MGPNGKDEIIEIGSSDDDRARKRAKAPRERLNTAPSFERFAHPMRTAKHSFPVRPAKADRPGETVDLTQDDEYDNPRKRLDKLMLKSGKPPSSSTPANSAPGSAAKASRASGAARSPDSANRASPQPPENHTATSPVIVDSDDEGETTRTSRNASVPSGSRVPVKTASGPETDVSRKRARETHSRDLPDKRQRLNVPSSESNSGTQKRTLTHDKARSTRTGIENQSPVPKDASAKAIPESPNGRPRSAESRRGTPGRSTLNEDAFSKNACQQSPVSKTSVPRLGTPANGTETPRKEVSNSADHRLTTPSKPARPTPSPSETPGTRNQKSKVLRSDATLDPQPAGEAAHEEAVPSLVTGGLSPAKANLIKDHSISSNITKDRLKLAKGHLLGHQVSKFNGVSSQLKESTNGPQPWISEAGATTPRTSSAAAGNGGPRSSPKVVQKSKDKFALETELAERTARRSLPPRNESADPLGLNGAKSVSMPIADSSEGRVGAPMSFEEEIYAQVQGEMAAARDRHSMLASAHPGAEGDRKADSKLPNSATIQPSALLTASGLTLPRQVELTVGKHLAAMREDTGYFGRMWMKRARRSKKGAPQTLDPDAAAGAGTERGKRKSVAGSIFAKMRPLQPTSSSATSAKAKVSDNEIKVSVETSPGTPKAAKSYQVFRPVDFETLLNGDVPGYAHYVSLGTNMLAPNTMTMNVWPYFGDNEPQGDAFDEHYYVDVSERPRKLKRLQQAQKAEEYVEMTLKDLEISWSDVLRVLLDPSPDFGKLDNAEKVLADKKALMVEDVPQSSEKWTKLLSNLAPSTQTSLARALFLCHSFQRIASFPLWHVARRCELVKQDLAKQQMPPSKYEDRTCRICFRFNCYLHGELRENEDSDSDIGYESDTAVATDLTHPQKVNYRKRLPFRTLPDPGTSIDTAPARSAAKKQPRYWDNGAYEPPADRGPFYPCDHPGLSCDDEEADCSCVRKRIPCEKTCACPKSCRHKFAGCACSPGKARKAGEFVCLNDDRCACFQAGRECDPDLCGSCGSCDVVDPITKYDDSVTVGKCRNAVMQRGVPKRTLLGDSGVHGMGLYAGENIQRAEFVGEYKGEIITSEEAERRGTVYDIQGLSYLFTLNSKQLIDSTYYGNKMRFINHRSVNANVYARMVMVNTVHRIAMYGARPIKAGEELFFNYGETFPEEKLGGKKEREKVAPHLRNARQIDDFYEIEEVRDQDGNIRARKAAGEGKATARAKKGSVAAAGDGLARPAPKKRGGARPGAGRKPKKAVTDEAEKLKPAPATRKDVAESRDVEREEHDTPEHRLANYYISDERPLEDQLDTDAPVEVAESEDEDGDFDPESKDGDEDEEGSEEDDW